MSDGWQDWRDYWDDPPKGIRPHGEPLVETTRSYRPLSEWLIDHDWTPECDKCCAPATHYVQYHPVGRCDHPCFGGERLQHLLVCGAHLGWLERESERLCRELNCWWGRLFRPPVCSSCGAPVGCPGDVLKEVNPL